MWGRFNEFAAAAQSSLLQAASAAQQLTTEVRICDCGASLYAVTAQHHLTLSMLSMQVMADIRSADDQPEGSPSPIDGEIDALGEEHAVDLAAGSDPGEGEDGRAEPSGSLYAEQMRRQEQEQRELEVLSREQDRIAKAQARLQAQIATASAAAPPGPATSDLAPGREGGEETATGSAPPVAAPAVAAAAARPAPLVAASPAAKPAGLPEMPSIAALLPKPSPSGVGGALPPMPSMPSLPLTPVKAPLPVFPVGFSPRPVPAPAFAPVPPPGAAAGADSASSSASAARPTLPRPAGAPLPGGSAARHSRAHRLA